MEKCSLNTSMLAPLFLEAKKIADEIKEKQSFADVFPLDIRSLVSRYGIRICETALNADTGFCLQKEHGYAKLDWESKLTIYIENSDNEFCKRYTLCRELCRCISDDPFSGIPKVNSSVDLVTAYLLLPPESVLEYMNQYIDELRQHNTYPVTEEDWILKLSQKAQLTAYHTTICFQYLKFYFHAVSQDEEYENAKTLVAGAFFL